MKGLFSFNFVALFVIFLSMTGCSSGKNNVDPLSEKEFSVFFYDDSDDSEEELDPALSETPEENLQELTANEKKILEEKDTRGLVYDLDIYESKEMEQYFTLYTHRARKSFSMWLKRSEPFIPYILDQLDKHGLPQDLVLLPFSESGYNSLAYSWAGAAGMWQFMPSTGKRYGLRVDWWIDERRDPYLATEAAIKYLKYLHSLFGDWYLALAAYNAGEGKIARALKTTNSKDFFELAEKNHTIKNYRTRLRKETKDYVPKFIAISKIFRNLDELGFEPLTLTKHNIEAISIKGGTDLLSVAKVSGLSWTEFHNYNPAFKRQVSPPHMTTIIRVPTDKLALVTAHLKKETSRPYAGYDRYIVRSGDSWWRISRATGVPIHILKSLNNRKSNMLRPGQALMLPGAASVQYAKKTRAKQQPALKKMAIANANYIIQANDNLWDISQRSGSTVSEIKKANGLRSNRLYAGQKLYIPNLPADAINASKNVHIVAKNESISTIADKYSVRMASIKTTNNLKSNTLTVGQKIIIPAQEKKLKINFAKARTAKKYTVRRGDTLWSISQKHGISMASLQEWNSLEGSYIRPGDTLSIFN